MGETYINNDSHYPKKSDYKASTMHQHQKQSKFSKIAIITALMSLSMSSSQAQQINVKSSTYTTNDGVTPDRFISYIQLNGSQGIQVPLEDVRLNTKLAYTVMMWMKPQDKLFGKNYQYAVSFDDSLECYFSGTEQMMCDSDSQGARLKVPTTNMTLNQWTHVTIAGNPTTSQSYLQLDQNGKGVVAQNAGGYLNLQQKYQPWRVCLGGCSQDYVFVGGIREFKVFTSFVNQTQASVLKNNYMLWDSQLLAYFRFSEADLLGSEITSKKAQITSDYYKSVRDYSANDICYPINSYLSLYRFKTSNDFQVMKLDGRFTPQTSNWGYTLSTWLKLNSTTCYQSNPTLAKQNCYILLLEDAFMIFSPAPNQIAAYFFNQKAYYQYQTKSIAVPNNQWFNLQFVASQYFGYEFRVYDILGRLMATTVESRNLQDSVVKTKQLKVFSQFSGIVKNLILYQSKRTLPLNFPYVDFTAADPNIIDNECLLYVEFQQTFITYSTSLQMKNLCRHSQFGMMHLNINSNIDDDYIGTYWKTFTTPTNDGLINSSPKFDGVACEDDDTVLEIKKRTSTISTSTLKSIPSAPNVTIEFWFRTQVAVIDTSYLMSLWGRVRSREYFSIFYDSSQNKKLICAPFGYLSTTSPFVAFDSFTDANRQASGWFHLACQYEQQKEVVGYFYNSNNVEDKVVTSLTNSSLFLQPDTYDIYVGNDAAINQGTVGSRFKEVRLWASKRTETEIKYWRFRQIDPKLYNNDIFLIYLRLNEGGFSEYNAAQLIDESLIYPVVAFQDVNYSSDSNLTICPTSTFLSSSDKKCYSDPVQLIDCAIYPVYDNSTQTLNWLFSADESIMMDNTVTGQIRSNWIFNDEMTQAIINKNSQYKNGINLKVPSSVFKDGSSYNVRLNFSNSDLSFVEYKDIQFVPKSCQYYIMSGSNAYSSYLNYTQTQSKYDITFTIASVTLKSYCNEISFYNQLVNSVQYKFSPALTTQPSLTLTTNQDQSITVTIPAKEQTKFPLQQNISIIFSLQYQNSFYLQQGISLQSDKIFQNVKQTIQFNQIGQTLSTSIQANSTNVYNKQGVTLSAQTLISNADTNDYKRMTYTWVCPPFIRSQCPTTNTTSFTITSNQFIAAQGVYENLYTFQINVTYLDLWNSLTFDVKSIQVNWINLDSPEFKIVPPTTPILATADNQSFNIKFDSYPTLAEIPSTISIVWSIVPNISSSNFAITNSSTNLTVRANGFQTYTAYTVSVTAINRIGNNTISRYQFTTFTTNTPPSGGTVSISPFIGYVGETNLTVSILNWQSSNKPITYRVWSTTNAGGTTPNRLISTEWISESQTFRFIPQDTYPYLIQITDTTGEVVFVKNTPAITVRQSSANSASISTLIQQQQKLQIILETQSISDKYDSLTTFATNELNPTQQGQNNSSSTTNNDQEQIITEVIAKTQSKIAIVDNIQSDANQILVSLKSESDSSIVSKGALTVLTVILDDQKTLNNELVQKTVDVIKSILSQDETVVQSLLRDSNFLKNFANSISNLMNYQGQQTTKGRLLQQDYIATLSEQTRQLKAVLENQMCIDSIENQAQQQIATSAFNLMVQKFTLDTPYITKTYRFVDDSVSGITFNTQKISQSLRQQSTSILDTFCIMSTFLKTNSTLSNTNEKQKYSPQIAEFQIQNVRTKQSYDPTLYTPQDNVNVEFQVNPSTFKHNQTICMSYSPTDKEWNEDSCITTIDTKRVSLKCQCNVIDSNQYALINDYSRMLASSIEFSEVPVIDGSGDDIINQQSYIRVQSSYSFFIMASFLLIVMFVLPVLSIILDKRDFRAQQENELNKNTIKVLEKLSMISGKSVKYWMMRNIEVQESIIGTKSQISLVLQEIHPVFNILSKYSIEQPRIIRFATNLLQTSLFALIVTLAYNPNYRSEDASRIEEGLDQKDIGNVIGFGFLGMIMLIPVQFLTRLFSRTVQEADIKDQIIQVEQSRNQNYQQDQNSNNEPNTIQISPNKVLYTNQRILQKSMSQTVETQRPSLQIIGENQNQELQITQKCSALFYLILTIGYILSVTAIALCFVYASQMPVSNQYCLVASFYVGLFGSIVITNLARVLLNSLLVGTYDRFTGCTKMLLRLILAKETIDMYNTQKLIKEAVHMKVNQHQSGTQQSLQSHRANQDNKVQLDLPSKNINGELYNLQRGQSIDASKIFVEFQKPQNQEEEEEVHELDSHNDSISFQQLQQINDDTLQNKSLSPSQFRNSNVQIDIEEISCNLNSSVDIRTVTQESHNMKSISPMTQSVSNLNQGSKGLFNTMRRDGSMKLVKNQNNNLNSTSLFKRSKQQDLSTSPKNSMLRSNSGPSENKKYAQIMLQNQSHNEDLMNCDDSNRVQLP